MHILARTEPCLNSLTIKTLLGEILFFPTNIPLMDTSQHAIISPSSLPGQVKHLGKPVRTLGWQVLGLLLAGSSEAQTVSDFQKFSQHRDPGGVLIHTWEMSDPLSGALMDCLIFSRGGVGNAWLVESGIIPSCQVVTKGHIQTFDIWDALPRLSRETKSGSHWHQDV